ncbi:ATP-binding cassette domain-containing protein [Bifidobacterium sp. SMB2]|uniref:ATP-binding cassette domain-containing protein n=1 Tax=Bifidobacterium saimiriisciurei TaxID=2661627 RepID=A0ABX0C822_9BIFI|nr:MULTISPECIES: ABC transporter ATP-binding protein [Bifidobacterium]NEG96167.1 ATP-binding cassette domain-containing protein [Bifidobacterium sp. SMB2]NEH10755.1 ATP-binding cassette domain-containing protein [Bifidobacterium saimiriisciurei]
MLLDVRELTREFVRRGRTFAAVDHVDLQIDDGDFVAIVGRSGNGKSTLLNMICGLLKPSDGTVLVCGRNVAELDDRDLSLLRNRVVGFVTQSQTLLPNLTIVDNVMLPALMFPKEPLDIVSSSDDGPDAAVTVNAVSMGESSGIGKTDVADPDMPDVIVPMRVEQTGADRSPDGYERRAMALLADLGIADLAGSYPRELSGGEMRRASIARALMNGPRLLIADEPTGDLDAESTAVVMRLLRSVADSGTAVLMVTHDADAMPYADRIITMDAGRLTESAA